MSQNTYEIWCTALTTERVFEHPDTGKLVRAIGIEHLDNHRVVAYGDRETGHYKGQYIFDMSGQVPAVNVIPQE